MSLLTSAATGVGGEALGGVTGRYVRLSIRENGAGEVFWLGVQTVGGHAAIAEVEFQEYVSP